MIASALPRIHYLEKDHVHDIPKHVFSKPPMPQCGIFPMRVLLISNWFPPVASGSSFYAGSLALALKSQGHDVQVVTADWGKRYAPSADYPLPVHRLPCIRLYLLHQPYNLW